MADIKRNDIGYFIRNTRYMIAIGRSMGAQVILATDPVSPELRPQGLYAREVPRHNEGIRRLAKENGVLLADIAESLRDRGELFMTGRLGKHLNQRGEQWKSDWFARYFTERKLLPMAELARSTQKEGSRP